MCNMSGMDLHTGKELYHLPENIQTRWASAENLHAAKGAGGQAGKGRKGSPCHGLKAGESFVMAHAEGCGTVRRIWVTIDNRTPEMLRGIKIEMFWDGEVKPAVQAPLADFFCTALGRNTAFENIWFSNPEGRSFNCRIPMPFKKSMKIMVTNETDKDLGMFFYDVNYTLGEEHGPNVPYFHAHYRRENPTSLLQDYEILPRIEGRGRFLGCNIGVISNMEDYGRSWWGEGEVKMYVDGDTEYPTLCGTGTEDYIGTGWGQGQYSHLYQGCHIADHDRMEFCFYRLHDPDPVYFYHDIRITIQQIGNFSDVDMIKFMEEKGITEIPVPGYGNPTIQIDELRAKKWNTHNFERHDDWSSTAYFYLDKPSNSLPAIDSLERRTIGLKGDPQL